MSYKLSIKATCRQNLLENTHLFFSYTCTLYHVTSYKHVLHQIFLTTFDPSAPWFINKEKVLALPFQTRNNSHEKTETKKKISTIT